jgi:hypothetical protein
MKWLFLVHQVQTPNSRERVKAWRLTKKVGAILYRNSVYVLPYSKERLEDFQWLCQQIRDSKGEASVFVSEADSPEEDRQLKVLFEQTREKEFAALQNDALKLLARLKRPHGQPPLTDVQTKRLRKEYVQLLVAYAESKRVDFFPGKASENVQHLLYQVAKQLESSQPQAATAVSLKRYSTRAFQNKLWRTREHIHIDRLCSAWLIKRFVDPKARFVFAPESAMPVNAIPFDVFGEEFSHHGDDCTFETLLKAFQIKDKALESIAQIVHDIDIKDGKFGRAEATGIDAVVRALSDSLHDDHRTLEVGSLLLDALYDHFTHNKKKGR